MSDLLLIKTASGSLMPGDSEAVERLAKIKPGARVRAKVSQPRNYKFHQKWFCLAQYAYSIWVDTVPEMEYRGVSVEPNFDRFRKDLTILAGYFNSVFNIRGELRVEAKSISFAGMGEDEFERLYSATINAVLRNILGNQMDEEQLRNTINQLLEFE